jgi:hypothetical protein
MTAASGRENTSPLDLPSKLTSATLRRMSIFLNRGRRIVIGAVG